MNMIGHQDVGVQGTAMFPDGFLQAAQVAPVVLFSIEDRFTVDAANNHVLRFSGKDKTGFARHKNILVLLYSMMVGK